MAEGNGGNLDQSPTPVSKHALGGEVSYGDGTAAFYTKFKSDPTSPFFSRDEVTAGLNVAGTNVSRHQYGSALLHQIDQYGNHSIGHLCLPTKPFYYLLRRSIYTIPDLRKVLSEPRSLYKSGDKWKVKILSDPVVRNALAEFDELLTNHLANQPVKP